MARPLWQLPKNQWPPWSSQIHRCSRAKGPGKQKATQAKHLLGGTLLASGRGHVGETATENHMINGFKIFLRGRCQKSDFRNGAFIQILYKVARIANGLVVGSQRPLKLLSPAKGDRRKFRSQTSDTMDRCKAEMGRVRDENRREEKRRDETKRDEKRREEDRTSKKRKSQKKEDPGARKGRKVAKHHVFPMMCGSGGSKSRLAKWRVRSHVVRWEMKNCTPLWREAHLEVKMYKAHHARGHFWKLTCRKSALVARSTFGSQNVQNTPCSDHVWKLTCRKSARCCCAKHIPKSKCTKHTMLGPLLEVDMSKKCTPLWREAHFEVKSAKNWRVRALLEVETSKKRTRLWHEAHFESKV